MENENLTTYDEDDYLHVGALIRSYLRFLVHRWYIFLILILIPVAVVFIMDKAGNRSWYTDTVYYSLERTGDVVTDAVITARVAESVDIVIGTSDFTDQLQKNTDIDIDTMRWYFVGTYEENSDLFHVTVYCSERDGAEKLLKSFEQIFPAWVNKTTGKTTLTVKDENLDGESVITGAGSGKKMIYAAVIGFLIWFVIATIIIASVKKIYGEGDMYQVVNARCLGILPQVQKKKRDKSTRETLLVTNEHLDNNFQQSMRSLASRIERHLPKERQVIMITSTFRQEGKSLITMNLALTFKKHGKRVVVVDGDLYRSGLNKIMQTDKNQEGLSDYILNGSKNKKITTTYEGVAVITAGTEKMPGIGPMNIERFQELITELKNQADIILIDTPPAGELGDAAIYSTMAEQVIYVIRGNYAEVSDIRKAIEPFVQNHKLAGYVLNFVNNTSVNSTYGYGYGGSYSKYRNYGSYGNHYGSHHYGYGSDTDDEKSERKV